MLFCNEVQNGHKKWTQLFKVLLCLRYVYTLQTFEIIMIFFMSFSHQGFI